MNIRPSTRKIAGLIVLIVVLFVFGALSVAAPIEAASSAQRATPTYTSGPTDTPEPTNTSEPTETPTDTPEPTATATQQSGPTEPAATETPETPTEEPSNPTPTFTPTPTTDDDPDDGDDGSDDDDTSGDDAAEDDSSECLARVEGFVVDAGGAGIPNTTVTLSGTGWSTTWQTDSNGFFYFDGVCAGTVIVSSTIAGQPVAQNVRVTGAANSVVEATLRPGSQPQAQPPTATVTPVAEQQPAPQPTATPQVVQRLPRTGTTTSRFLLLGLLLAGIMIGVRLVRARGTR